MVCRIGRSDSRLSRKLAQGEAVQSVGLPRQLDVVGNIGFLTNQLVRLDDKAAYVPANQLNSDKAARGRKDRQDKAASALRRDGVDGSDRCAENERHTNKEQAGKRNVRVRVGHTAKDRVCIEQSLEPVDIHAYREDQQQKGKRDGEPAPGQS